MFHKDSEEFRSILQRYHIVIAAAFGAPLVLIVSFLMFPFLERWKLGYPSFSWACVLAFGLAVGGVIAWIFEGRFRGKWFSWGLLLLLLLEIPGALFIAIRGQFYWAFERGCFLN